MCKFPSSFVFVASQPLLVALVTMAPLNVVSFLAGSVRLLQKRVDMLESVRPFSFNPEAPESTPKTLLRLESLVLLPRIFDLQSADVHFAALVDELMKDDNVSASDAIEPKLLDGAIQRAEAVLRASDATEQKLLDDAIQRDEAALRVSDAIEPKLLDDVIQHAEALRVSDVIEPTLFDDVIQHAEAVLRDWKFPADNFVEPEISFEYWKFSEETCVDISDSDSVSEFEDHDCDDYV